MAEAGAESQSSPHILQIVAARPQGEYTVFAADMFSTVKLTIRGSCDAVCLICAVKKAVPYSLKNRRRFSFINGPFFPSKSAEPLFISDFTVSSFCL